MAKLEKQKADMEAEEKKQAYLLLQAKPAAPQPPLGESFPSIRHDPRWSLTWVALARLNGYGQFNLIKNLRVDIHALSAST